MYFGSSSCFVYRHIFFAIAEIRNLFLCNEILDYLLHESESWGFKQTTKISIKIGEAKWCAALLIVVYIFVMFPLLSSL